MGHLQWDIMSNSPTSWANLYWAGTLGMGDTILSRYEDQFMEIACPTEVHGLGSS